MSRKANPSVVGAFVVGGLALLVIGIVVLASVRFFPDTQRVVVYFRQSVTGLRTGAVVEFKGIEVGRVHDIRISLSKVQQRPDLIRIPVVLELDKEKLSAEGTRIDFGDPRTVQSLIKDGLRAELATESLLTGLRYVSLDMKPGTPVELVGDPRVNYPEIPSLVSRDEELQAKAADILTGLSQVDFEGLFQSMKDLTDSTRKVVAAPELQRSVERLDSLTANLDKAVVEMRRTAREIGPSGSVGRNLESASKNAAAIAEQSAESAESMRRLVQPDGALFADLESTLTELHDAARSLRRLADQVNRDPGAILRGGPE